MAIGVPVLQRGPQGPQGPAGPQGPQGPQGPPGATGPSTWPTAGWLTTHVDDPPATLPVAKVAVDFTQAHNGGFMVQMAGGTHDAAVGAGTIAAASFSGSGYTSLNLSYTDGGGADFTARIESLVAGDEVRVITLTADFTIVVSNVTNEGGYAHD